MPPMGKKPPEPEKQVKTRLVVWVTQKMRADLETMARRGDRTLTAEFVRGMRRYLREAGFEGYEEPDGAD
jgi:hypothetical protein